MVPVVATCPVKYSLVVGKQMLNIQRGKLPNSLHLTVCLVVQNVWQSRVIWLTNGELPINYLQIILIAIPWQVLEVEFLLKLVSPVQRRHIRSLSLLLLRKMGPIIRYLILPMILPHLLNPPQLMVWNYGWMHLMDLQYFILPMM